MNEDSRILDQSNLEKKIIANFYNYIKGKYNSCFQSVETKYQQNWNDKNCLSNERYKTQIKKNLKNIMMFEFGKPRLPFSEPRDSV